jgi:hypothetical protein
MRGDTLALHFQALEALGLDLKLAALKSKRRSERETTILKSMDTDETGFELYLSIILTES